MKDVYNRNYKVPIKLCQEHRKGQESSEFIYESNQYCSSTYTIESHYRLSPIIMKMPKAVFTELSSGIYIG